MKKLVPDNKESETLVIDPARMVSVEIEDARVDNKGYALAARDGGPFGGKAIYLDEGFEWVIGLDDEDCICLVPLRLI